MKPRTDKNSRTLSEGFHEATAALGRLHIRRELIEAEVKRLESRIKSRQGELAFINSRIAHWKEKAKDKVNA